MTITPKTKAQTLVSQISTSSQQVDVQGTIKNVEADTRPEEVSDRSSIHIQKYVEVILAFLTSEVTLNVEENCPLDIFYNSQHTMVVKRGRKKIKLEKSQSSIPIKIYSFEVLWNGSSTTPSEELGKLTQFTGAYASTTIDKATKFQELLKEKEETVASFKQKFNVEKQQITK